MHLEAALPHDHDNIILFSSDLIYDWNARWMDQGFEIILNFVNFRKRGFGATQNIWDCSSGRPSQVIPEMTAFALKDTTSVVSVQVC